MKRIITTLFVACAVGVSCVAQSAIDEALADYDFQKAESLLNAEIKKVSRRRQPTDQLEAQLQYVHQAMRMMSAVERVVVFDSVVVPRQAVFSALSLSPESGKVCPVNAFPAVQVSDGDGTLFQSQIGDKLFYGAPDAGGTLQLFGRDVLGGELSAAERLEGLSDETGVPHNYPYMMADGLTLYYAAQGEESLGGYDIFMTRYDADDHRFLTSENVGMPFNSPANDYLLCIDETYNVGCFVSDRGMPWDSVCVYYFIPNDMRRIYIEEEVGEEALRRLARLSDISMTWLDETQVRAARARLQECMRVQESEPEPDFTFQLADNRICHWLSDFSNRQARSLVEKWLQDLDKLDQYRATLDEMRQGYAVASSTQRTLMRAQVLRMEEDIESLVEDLKKQEKAIRKAELGL